MSRIVKGVLMTGFASLRGSGTAMASSHPDNQVETHSHFSIDNRKDVLRLIFNLLQIHHDMARQTLSAHQQITASMGLQITRTTFSATIKPTAKVDDLRKLKCRMVTLPDPSTGGITNDSDPKFTLTFVRLDSSHPEVVPET